MIARHPLDRTVDVTAGGVLLVEHDRAQAELGSGDGGRHPGRTRAHDGKIVRLAHGFSEEDVRGVRRTRMPSAAAIMQACLSGMPSISTRHSKHTPIVQYGARGAPLTGFARLGTAPASSNAAATLAPARTAMGL